MLELEDDWDDMEAVEINKGIYFETIDLLMMYAEYIYRMFDKTIIRPPEINPVPNGTVDLSWRTPNANLLMNIKIKNDSYLTTCYGHSKDSVVVLEGLVNMGSVDNDIASWMKKLKT
jgi:hypothetical protein